MENKNNRTGQESGNTGTTEIMTEAIGTTTESSGVQNTAPQQSGIDHQKLAEQLLAMEMSAQMQKIRQLVLLRMALEGDVKPTRIPVPANITEVGGYYNLLRRQNQSAMMRQMVASAVGIANDCTPDLTEQLIRKLITDLIEQK